MYDDMQLDEVGREGVRNILRRNILDVTFTKADGSTRIMKCTLDEQHIPQFEKKEGSKTKKMNPDVCSVWDVQNQGWRSFRWDSLKKIGF